MRRNYSRAGLKFNTLSWKIMWIVWVMLSGLSCSAVEGWLYAKLNCNLFQNYHKLSIFFTNEYECNYGSGTEWLIQLAIDGASRSGLRLFFVKMT